MWNRWVLGLEWKNHRYVRARKGTVMRWTRRRVDGMRLTEWRRELIPQVRWCTSNDAIDSLCFVFVSVPQRIKMSLNVWMVLPLQSIGVEPAEWCVTVVWSQGNDMTLYHSQHTIPFTLEQQTDVPLVEVRSSYCSTSCSSHLAFIHMIHFCHAPLGVLSARP